MEENTVLKNKSNYIIISLVVILLIIVVVSVNQLFNTNLNNDLLEIANKKLTKSQIDSEIIIKTQKDSIADYSKELKKLNKQRKTRKEVIINIHKESDKNVKVIISDDIITDANAIANIYRTYPVN